MQVNETKKRLYLIILLVITLILVLIPRFDRNDIGIVSNFTGKGECTYDNGDYRIENLPKDPYQYMLITDYFSGEDVLDKIVKPYSYRPLVPILASLIPLNPMTSLNIINALSMILSVIILFRFLEKLGFSVNQSTIGCLMFIISFPMFYYAVVGILDPPAMLIIVSGLYVAYFGRWLWLLIIMLIGAFVKETVIILLPVYFLLYFNSKEHRRILYVRTAITFVLFVAAMYLSRIIIPIESSYFWTPAWHTVMENITRPRTYISFAITFGIPGLFSLYGMWHLKKAAKDRQIIYMPLAAGVFLAFCLFLFSIVSAYSDGRFIWFAYPFAIPLAMYYLKKYVK